jgi:hypothetical protein
MCDEPVAPDATSGEPSKAQQDLCDVAIEKGGKVRCEQFDDTKVESYSGSSHPSSFIR